MPNNAPHNALRAAVNRAISEGAPIYVNRMRHDVSPDTLKCVLCGLFAFECVDADCDPGRPNDR